jgi:hypothetical protein
VSENSAGVGGDMPSREPDISADGNTIVYSTQASNLLTDQLTRADGKVFSNHPVKHAKAQAVVVGGNGVKMKSCFRTRIFKRIPRIKIDSGSGSGAVASYEVDSTVELRRST